MEDHIKGMDVRFKGSNKSHAKNSNGIEKLDDDPYLKCDSIMIKDNDTATCIVDLNKVKAQYELWQESFGGM